MAMQWHAKVLTIKATDEPAPALSAIRASALLISLRIRETHKRPMTSNGAMGAMEQWSIEWKN